MGEQLERLLRLAVRQFPSGREEDSEPLRRPAALELGDPAYPRAFGASEWLVTERGRLLGKRHRIVVLAGLARFDRRGDEAAPARQGIGCQLRSPLVRPGRGRMAPAIARAHGGVFQFAQDFFVPVKRGGHAMPGAAVGLVLVERLGQRTVDCASIVRCRALVHRRPHERMAELQS
jgi:hypothetical protein